MSSNNDSAFKMNLNEYLVTLDKPLGIRFALTSDGKIIVHSLAKGVSKTFPLSPYKYLIWLVQNSAVISIIKWFLFTKLT